MNEEQFGYFKLLKLKHRRGENNYAVLQNWFPQQIRLLLFNLRKFKKSEERTSKSCRMHRNLMNNKEFGSNKENF